MNNSYHSISNIRNIGIIAHVDAGKTTFSERVLYFTGAISYMGEVQDGTATMDFLPEERDRGITISSACTTVNWKNCVVNLIDTPGHIDFTVEVKRSLRVLDSAIGLFCGISGVEPQSENVWKQAEFFNIPRIAIINKLDRVGADFESAINSLKERLNISPLPLTLPLKDSDNLIGVIDLINKRKIIYNEASLGNNFKSLPFTQKDFDINEKWIELLLDKLSLLDEQILSAYCNGKEVSADILTKAIRKGVLSNSFTPVFAISALKNIGIQPVLDAINQYLPSPKDMYIKFTNNKELENLDNFDEFIKGIKLNALVFKVVGRGKGKTLFLRIYSGSITANSTLYNSSQKQNIDIGSILRVCGEDKSESLKVAYAGDIVAIEGDIFAKTGDTITEIGEDIVLESISLTSPVVSLRFEPSNEEEGLILNEALSYFCEEDPSLKLDIDINSGSRVIHGMGELHLDVLKRRLEREFSISPRVGKPQVVEVEKLVESGVGTSEVRDLATKELYGHVNVEIIPDSNVDLVSFKWINKDDIPEDTFLRVEEIASSILLNEARGSGLKNVRCEIKWDLSKEPTIVSMCLAVQSACWRAVEDAKYQLYEPIMEFVILVPDDYLGQALTLMQCKESKIQTIEDNLGKKEVKGYAPMRMLFNIAVDLRSATQGKASINFNFYEYQKSLKKQS